MEVIGVVPTDIKYNFGLFLRSNFVFGEPERRQLEKLGTPK
jgi:hypothetical protein